MAGMCLVLAGDDARLYEGPARKFLESCACESYTVERVIPHHDELLEWVLMLESDVVIGCIVLHRLSQKTLHLSIVRASLFKSSDHRQEVVGVLLRLLGRALNRGNMLQVRCYSPYAAIFTQAGYMRTHVVQHRLLMDEDVMVFSHNPIIPHLARSIDSRNPLQLLEVPPCANTKCDQTGTLICQPVSCPDFDNDVHGDLHFALHQKSLCYSTFAGQVFL